MGVSITPIPKRRPSALKSLKSASRSCSAERSEMSAARRRICAPSSSGSTAARSARAAATRRSSGVVVGPRNSRVSARMPASKTPAIGAGIGTAASAKSLATMVLVAPTGSRRMNGGVRVWKSATR